MADSRTSHFAVPIKRHWWTPWIRLKPSQPLPVTQHCVWGNADDQWFRCIHVFGLNIGIMYRGERHGGELPVLKERHRE